MKHWWHDQMPAPCWRLYHNPSPGAWVERAGQRVGITPDQSVLIPPGAPLHTGHSTSFDHLFIHFSLSPAYQLKHDALYAIPVLNIEKQLWNQLQQAIAHPKADPTQHGLLVHHLITHHLLQIPKTQWRETIRDSRIQMAIEMIHEKSDHHFAVPQLADAVGLHDKSFSRLFKQHTGQSPAQYMLSLRLDGAARDLLHDEDSVEQVAEHWGFSDRYHLTRMLKKHRHMTPGQYIRQSRGA